MKTTLALLVLLMFSQAASAMGKKPRSPLYDHATQVAIMHIVAHYTAITVSYDIDTFLREQKKLEARCEWNDEGMEVCYEPAPK